MRSILVTMLIFLTIKILLVKLKIMEKGGSAILNFILRIMADDEILESINSLNPKQRGVLNIVHTTKCDFIVLS